MQNDRAKFRNVVRGFLIVIASRRRGNPKESQNSKIKMQNDRARINQKSKSEMRKVFAF
jgi:hypothetical protein